MASTLFWTIVGIVGAVLAANKARALWAEQPRTALAGWDESGTTARLGIARDVSQHYARLIAAVAVAAFCALLAISGLTSTIWAAGAWVFEMV